MTTDIFFIESSDLRVPAHVNQSIGCLMKSKYQVVHYDGIEI